MRPELPLVVPMLAVVVGIIGTGWIVVSAVRTVVMPRPERVWLTTTQFEFVRRFSFWLAKRWSDPCRRHRILGSFAPAVLLSLPLVWSIGIVVSFGMMFWGLSSISIFEALELSGSSLTTLGFETAPNRLTTMLAIVEALLGLAVVALMISFLPTLYSTFSTRELAVQKLTVRAGDPPNPLKFIARLHHIDQLEHVGHLWDDWESWFVHVGETHTTFPGLIYFRSSNQDQNWLSAAEVALDTAAIVLAADLAPQNGEANTMIRSGYLSLRAIADHYQIEPEHDISERANLSVTREQFEDLLDAIDQVTSLGLSPDVFNRDEAWEAYAGWRVNYDQALVGLRENVGEVASHWSTNYANGAGSWLREGAN